MKYTKGEILLNDEIQTGIYKMVVKDKNKAKAGQFYMLKHKWNNPSSKTNKCM